MNYAQSLMMSLLLILSLALGGCQGNNSDAPPAATSNVTTPPEVETLDPDLATQNVVDVFLNPSTKDLVQNSQIVEIQVRVYDQNNNPYSDGVVKINYPSDVRQNRDVGSFSDLNTSISNGVATFRYTGPSRLDENLSDILFKFYHESNPSGAKTYTFKIKPVADQVVLTSYVLSNSTSDGNLTMGIEQSKEMTFFIKDEDGVLVPDANVTNIRTTILNPAMATLSSTDGNETNETSVSLESTKNSFTLNINASTVSGVVPLRMDAEFFDVNNQPKTLSKVFYIIIISGPPSAISLTYGGSRVNDQSTGFLEKWVVRVTDKYSNDVNSNPSISMGMIAGYAKDSTSSGVGLDNYLYFGTTANATMSAADNTFRALTEVFENVNQDTDTLVVFGNGFTYDVSGKWDFTYENNTTLNLVEIFDGNDTSGLGFAVGNSIRQIPNDGGEAIGSVRPENNSYFINDLGYLTLEIDYDPYLVGKSVMLWVNLVGYDLENSKTVRIGEAKKVTLRANGLEAAVENTSAGETGVVHRIFMKIKDSPEWYRNANFGFGIKTSDNLTVNSVTTSNGNLANDVAYVDVNVTDNAPQPTAGTIEILNALVADEF